MTTTYSLATEEESAAYRAGNNAGNGYPADADALEWRAGCYGATTDDLVTEMIGGVPVAVIGDVHGAWGVKL